MIQLNKIGGIIWETKKETLTNLGAIDVGGGNVFYVQEIDFGQNLKIASFGLDLDGDEHYFESIEGIYINVRKAGTTDDGVLAVSCSLFKDEEEMDIASNQVNNNTFEGTFDVAGGTYTVKCANYEGGTIVSSEKADVKNPKTGDSVMKYVLILGISLTGLVGATLVLKKNENSLV